MPDPYLASNDFPGDGVTTLRTVSFKGNRPDAGGGTVPYLSSADVKASQITPATPTTPETETPLTVTYVGPNQFNVTPACPVGTICRVYRATQDEYNLVDYQALQTVSESDLDLANRQTIFIVQEAHDLAQRAKADISQATTVAYEAISTANEAETKADSAIATANFAQSQAAAAVVTANAASTTADAASATAATALSTANAIDGKAQDALDASAAAVATANAAAATAGAIAGTANTALANANAAVATANAAATQASSAESTANAIAGTANTALTNANAAVSTANTALSTANDALALANSFDTRIDNTEADIALHTIDISNINGVNATQASQISALQSGKQNLDATLTGLAALTIAANQVPIGSGTDTFTTIASGTAGRALLAAADSAAVSAALPDFYRRANILAAVDQSGGVPLGGIIQRGSNANGEFVRYADGTQICWGQYNLGSIAVTTADGALFRSGFVSSRSFAASFVGSPSCTIDVVSSTGTAWVTEGSAFPSTTGTQAFLIFSPSTGTISCSVMVIAIGRWF